MPISKRNLTGRASVFLLRAALIAGLCSILGACSASTATLTKAMIVGMIPQQPAVEASSFGEVAALPASDQPVAGAAVAAQLSRESQETPRPFKVASAQPGPGYDMVGMASWYGPRFHGRATANGETFDSAGLTAAHPSLPLPSYVRVTNLENSRSVIVRVNDRGPFARNRLIDVSEQTAELLAFRRSGSTRVQVEFVSSAPLHVDDKAKLLASYRGPRSGVAVAAAEPELRPTQVAFAEESPNGTAAGVMRSLTAAYSPSDRIFMAFDVTADAPAR